jgi:hypothetical protein
MPEPTVRIELTREEAEVLDNVVSGQVLAFADQRQAAERVRAKVSFALSVQEDGGEAVTADDREPTDDEWCCDGCGLIAPVDAESWEQTCPDYAGVTVEWCPYCKHESPWVRCHGRGEFYVGSMPYGGPGDSYAPCSGCPDCRKPATPQSEPEQKMPYVCSECDHSIAPGSRHGADCSRNPLNRAAPEQVEREDWPDMLYVVVDPPLGRPRRYAGSPDNTWHDTYEVRRYVPADRQPVPSYLSEEGLRKLDNLWLFRCPHHGLIDGKLYREREWTPEEGCPLLCSDEETCGQPVERFDTASLSASSDTGGAGERYIVRRDDNYEDAQPDPPGEDQPELREALEEVCKLYATACREEDPDDPSSELDDDDPDGHGATFGLFQRADLVARRALATFGLLDDATPPDGKAGWVRLGLADAERLRKVALECFNIAAEPGCADDDRREWTADQKLLDRLADEAALQSGADHE